MPLREALEPGVVVDEIGERFERETLGEHENAESHFGSDKHRLAKQRLRSVDQDQLGDIGEAEEHDRAVAAQRTVQVAFVAQEGRIQHERCRTDNTHHKQRAAPTDPPVSAGMEPAFAEHPVDGEEHACRDHQGLEDEVTPAVAAAGADACATRQMRYADIQMAAGSRGRVGEEHAQPTEDPDEDGDVA